MIPDENIPDESQLMRSVFVEAENSSTGGEFSTKAFMAACLKSIHHPIYGIRAKDDIWGEKLDASIHRAPEPTLRQSFEHALKLRETEYLIIDEAHHVRYVPGGDRAAARVLDSWKCLANKTKVKLVLSGSYELLPLLELAPHLIGRQSPLHFQRYQNTQTDALAWVQILNEFSRFLKFESNQSLADWGKEIFDGSLGCVGLLSRWIRSTLASMYCDGSEFITIEKLRAERLPVVQEKALQGEILTGEHYLQKHPSPPSQSPAPPAAPATSRPSKSKPFRRNSIRNPVGGRV